MGDKHWKKGRGCEKERFANGLRGHWRKMWYQVRRHLEDSWFLLKDRNGKIKQKYEIPTLILPPFPCGLSKPHSAATCQGPWDTPPETASTLSGPLKPQRHNSQCQHISILWDMGLLILCVTSSVYSKKHTGPRHWCFGERGSGCGGSGLAVELLWGLCCPSPREVTVLRSCWICSHTSRKQGTVTPSPT